MYNLVFQFLLTHHGTPKAAGQIVPRSIVPHLSAVLIALRVVRLSGLPGLEVEITSVHPLPQLFPTGVFEADVELHFRAVRIASEL